MSFRRQRFPKNAHSFLELDSKRALLAALSELEAGALISLILPKLAAEKIVKFCKPKDLVVPVHFQAIFVAAKGD